MLVSHLKYQVNFRSIPLSLNRVTAPFAAALNAAHTSLESDPESKRIFLRDGELYKAGEMFKQPNLARTMRAIVAAEKAAVAKSHNRAAAIRAGRDAFYQIG